MPRRRIHPDDHSDNINIKPTTQVGHAATQVAPAQLLTEEAVWEGSLGGQAELLASSQLLTAQRSSLAAQIGQVQGNRHLGQVLSTAGLTGQTARGDGQFNQRQDEPGTTATHPMISFGSQGSDVAEAQSKLNSAGADPLLEVDGIFGPLTQAAVVEFQETNSLSEDGIVGPITWAALDQIAPGPTEVGPEVVVPDIVGPDITGPDEVGPDITGPDVIGPETPVERWSDDDRARLASQTSDTGALNDYQALRAELRVYALSDPEYSALRSVLDSASSDMEWAFLVKAAAAQRSISDIFTFADRIRGMSERWLMRNLMVVDLTNDLTPGANPEETGIRQQYGNSCGPTSMQLIHAQADPIYALELRSAGPIDEASESAVSNPESVPNQELAGEQASILNAHVATGTGNAPTNLPEGGAGAWVESDMNALSAATGVTYTTKIIGTDITLDDAMSQLQDGLASDVQVPIIVGGGTGPTHTSHYVVVLIAAEGRFLIHDVATGDTVWRTEDEFRSNTLHLPSGWNFFVAIDVPALTPPPLPQPPTPASE